MANISRLVYSTETGRICPECGRQLKKCVCQRKKSARLSDVKPDGIIRIRRETKGRKGKTVTTISGFQESEEAVIQIAKDLKSKCGTGGSVKDGAVIIQGDHRKVIQAELKAQGFEVKVAGG